MPGGAAGWHLFCGSMILSLRCSWPFSAGCKVAFTALGRKNGRRAVPETNFPIPQPSSGNQFISHWPAPCCVATLAFPISRVLFVSYLKFFFLFRKHTVSLIFSSKSFKVVPSNSRSLIYVVFSFLAYCEKLSFSSFPNCVTVELLSYTAFSHCLYFFYCKLLFTGGRLIGNLLCSGLLE